MPGSLAPAQLGGRRGASVKTLKKLLKNAGLKTTGRKAALTRRAKKAHLKMRGGDDNGQSDAGNVGTPIVNEGEGDKIGDKGGRRRRRSRKGLFGY